MLRNALAIAAASTAAGAPGRKRARRLLPAVALAVIVVPHRPRRRRFPDLSRSGTGPSAGRDTGARSTQQGCAVRSLSRFAILAGVLLALDAVPAVAGAQSDPSLPAVVSSSTNWQLRDSLTTGPPTTMFSVGTRPVVPFTGDWDGNGSETPGTYSGGVLRLYNEIPPRRHRGRSRSVM